MVGNEDGYTPGRDDLTRCWLILYLHYVLNLWEEAWRKKVATGDVIVIRYADDVVLGFQYRTDAERFLMQLRKRLVKLGLALHPAKTRLIEFGRFAARTESSVVKESRRPSCFWDSHIIVVISGAAESSMSGA
jgi:Reverse transcriptase (RNA-dependent DNA polymerase)